MKSFRKLFFLYSIAFFGTIKPAQTIDQPGLYSRSGIVELGVDLITIKSSNVVLDLSEDLFGGGNNGIIIYPNLSNITIRNGKIAQIAHNGIKIGENCSNIRIEKVDIGLCGGNAIKIESGFKGGFFSDLFISQVSSAAVSVEDNSSSMRFQNLNISNCNGPAIELLGTSTADLVRDSLFEKVTTSSCCLSLTFSHVITVNYGKNITFYGANISSSGNFTNDIHLLEFNNCMQCLGREIFFIGNQGDGLTGLCFCNTQSSGAREISFINNSATSNLNGFMISEVSPNNLFVECRVLASRSQGNVIGFNIIDDSEKTVLRECDVASLVGENVIGYNLDLTENAKNSHILENCNVAQCTALTGSFVGYNIARASKSTLSNSVSSYNTAPNGRSVGLLFKQGFGGSKWKINNSQFVRNKGLDDANSYGILVESGLSNLFVQNFAFNNGGMTSHQMKGVPFASIAQLNTENLNSADTPWANIIVIP